MGSDYWKERSQPYKPGQTAAFKLSRSKIEDFINCPRCFWLDRRMKIARPSTPPFNINKAVDELFKKEFDVHRAAKTQHPLQKQFDVAAKPYSHPKIDEWRENFTGVVFVHPATNLHVFGAVDDLWENDNGQVHVVDYKATAKDEEITSLRPKGSWHDSYRRQMEVYQWLLRHNSVPVSNIGYFVYANGDASKPAFNAKVEFRINVFEHDGDDSWVEPTLVRIKECLEGPIPKVGNSIMGGACEYCMYAKSRTEMTLAAIHSKTVDK